MKKLNFLITQEMVDAAMDVGTLEFESCWYKDKECIECTVNEEDSFLLMDVDERFMYEKNMYNPDVYSNEEKISIIYNQLLKDYEDDIHQTERVLLIHCAFNTFLIFIPTRCV